MSFLQCQYNLPKQTKKEKDKCLEYGTIKGLVFAQDMAYLNSQSTERGLRFSQLFMLQKGLKVAKKNGYKVSLETLKQQHDFGCFTTVSVKSLTSRE